MGETERIRRFFWLLAIFLLGLVTAFQLYDITKVKAFIFKRFIHQGSQKVKVIYLLVGMYCDILSQIPDSSKLVNKSVSQLEVSSS